MTPAVSVSSDGGRACVHWPDLSRTFLAEWLLDHAEDARDPVSGQRTHSADVLEGVRVASARFENGALVLRIAGETASRRIAADRLRPNTDDHGDGPRLWPEPGEISEAPAVDFEAFLAEDEALQTALERVLRDGLVLLVGAGEDPGAVERAVARFGHIRETNYGRVFDVRIEPGPEHLAYTARALDLHTDNPYRDPVPTLQLLHAIVTDPEGGETVFVDGFAQADLLRRTAPEAFRVLARTSVRFSYWDARGRCWSAAAPIISLTPEGDLQAVRLNHRSMDLEPGDAELFEAWYGAYLAFHRLAHAPGAAFSRRLRPGEMVLFDNRRILHGRRALSTGSPRWLRGAYADIDGLKATLAWLSRRADR